MAVLVLVWDPVLRVIQTGKSLTLNDQPVWPNQWGRIPVSKNKRNWWRQWCLTSGLHTHLHMQAHLHICIHTTTYPTIPFKIDFINLLNSIQTNEIEMKMSNLYSIVLYANGRVSLSICINYLLYAIGPIWEALLKVVPTMSLSNCRWDGHQALFTIGKH